MNNKNLFGIEKNTRKDHVVFVPKNVVYKENDYLKHVALGAKINKPVLIIGPTGCGKTSAVKFLAQETNNAYRRVQLNGTTDIDTFVGKWLINKEGTYWVDGVFTDAMRNGHWVVLDEINAALPEILFVLHSVLDNDNVLVLNDKDGEIVKPHKDFRIFATMNPTDEYAGTKELNKAFLDRFPIVLSVDYPNSDVEEEIVSMNTGIAVDDKGIFGKHSIIKRLVDMANKTRGYKEKSRITHEISTRNIIDCVELSKELTVKEALTLSVLNKIEDKQSRNKIKDEMDVVFKEGKESFNKDLIEKKKTNDLILDVNTSNPFMEEMTIDVQ